jgi:dihydropyrimidinase
MLVTADSRWGADVRTRGGKIVEIARRLPAKGDERVIEAAGLQLLPGGIDPHAHLLPPWVDDYTTGSRAALAGGITTIGCMAGMRKDETLVGALDKEAKRVAAESITDIFLHPIIGSPGKELKEQLPQLLANGHGNIKIFMITQSFAENETAWTELIREAGRLGLITMLHCEDAQALAEAARKLASEGRTSLRYYAEGRSAPKSGLWKGLWPFARESERLSTSCTCRRKKHSMRVREPRLAVCLYTWRRGRFTSTSPASGICSRTVLCM